MLHPQIFEFNHALLVSCLVIHCLLGGSVFWIAAQYVRHRRQALAREHRLLALPLPPPDQLPHVLVQLPVYNEGELVTRVADAVKSFDWPATRLHVQILDDSTDGSVERSEAAARALRTNGIDAVVIRRGHRQGFKAGALAEGLRHSQQEYVAILDADYVPNPDFLRCCMRVLLNESGLGFVQARCDFLNAGDNMVTYAQQRVLDGHFAVEQAARNWSGQVMPFNGTCGIWRRSAIESAGGWQGDTLAEDLDLSYRAQLKGWRAQFLSTVAVRGELPGSMGVWRVQQFRWTKGFAEAGRKLLWRVWCSKLPIGKKLISTLHLGGGMLGPLVALTIFAAGIDLGMGYGPTWPVLGLVALSLIEGAIVGPATLMLVGQVLVRGSKISTELPRLPTVIGLQILMGLANFGGAVQAIIGRGTAFERTPKLAVRGDLDSGHRHYAPEAGP
jgi:cellulose synthase/poly-beta-1,6-N-acetylglucosamine synthase-like glycosyltransferase